MITDRIINGVAVFNNLQILDLAKTKIEYFVEQEQLLPVHIGKNAKDFFKNNKKLYKNIVIPEVDHTRTGNYFYWYTVPLVNYYHMLLDGVGCLTRYFELRKTVPDLKLILNCNPRPKGAVTKHPPFVEELLQLLDIDYEFTDENTVYEHVYFGDTIAQDHNRKRTRPDAAQYHLLQQCIARAKKSVQVQQYDNIYLSRRAHANPLNNRKAVIGEDNTVKRGLTNEDEVVDILASLGYTEVFGENYTLAEKIVLFNGMKKYISTAGAGVANILWTMPNSVSVGGIHTPGFPFPSHLHKHHICCSKEFIPSTISVYPGQVLFVDPQAGAKDYNNPWYINNLNAFKKWAATI